MRSSGWMLAMAHCIITSSLSARPVQSVTRNTLLPGSCSRHSVTPCDLQGDFSMCPAQLLSVLILWVVHVAMATQWSWS